MNQEWEILAPQLFTNERAALRCRQLLERKVKPLIFKKFRQTAKEVLLDCWAEAQLILWQQLRAGKAIAYPRAFLLLLTRNKIKDYYRNRKYRRTESLRTEKVPTTSARYDFEHREFLHYLFAKADISSRDQSLLVQHKAGYSDKELALAFGLRTDSVKVIRAKALQKLRKVV